MRARRSTVRGGAMPASMSRRGRTTAAAPSRRPRGISSCRGAMSEPARAVTHARVLRIAVPIVISNATVPILGAVDTGVVGQLGAAAPIGAVGLGAVILTAIYWVFGFLRMGTTGLASQAHGAGETGEVAALLTRVLMIGLAGGAAVIV